MLFNNGKVLSQKETSSCGVLSPGKPSPGSTIWRPALYLCTGPTRWPWLHWLQLEIRSSECSACVSGPLKFQEQTHTLCVPHSTAVFMLDKPWCQSQLNYGSEKLWPCCIILGVLRKSTCSKTTCVSHSQTTPKSLPATTLVDFFRSNIYRG